jgi:hypothetical protein
MKILIICSKAFYPDIAPIKLKLEGMGHKISLPNSYGHASIEAEEWAKGDAAHSEFKKRMFLQSAKVIEDMDAVVCLNFEKNGKANYIGGATFLELYEAFMKNKKIFLWNDIPEGMLFDEIHGFNPLIIKGNLDLVE